MPGEPWRYRCPRCNSVRVRKRHKLAQAKEVVSEKKFSTRNTTTNKWYCKSCQTALEAVYDVKFGQEVVGA